ncbi:MAG: murein biosynthesis integral membrane protein MurJ [Patescibacteria group bacterium]|nr:murein biosynthesis integral membrane protein MurJ [Patescibacteria group bacterium]MBU1870835.1 murein biosynthesis integral membrane protein MurJ [Patescibacteria group bacterium]
MIKRLFNGEINSITAAALLIGTSSLLSRFLGIFRDRILAGQFGAGDTLDIYYAAFRIPDLIFNLLILGALSVGFIPIFTNLIKRPLERIRSLFNNDHKEAWELASNVLNILGLGLLILCGLGVIFAPLIIKLITPGFNLEKMDLTINLSRIMFLSPIFLGISAVLGGILQSFKRFFVYSLSPIFYNIGIIIGALYLVPIWGIYGLAWGVVLGAFAHFLVQLPAVIKLGFKYSFKFDFKNKNVRQIGAIMAPRTMSLAISQINLVVITIIASTLSSGSLTIFNFANNLQFFPISIFGISFAIAAFPTLSTTAFDKKSLVKNISLVTRQILFFIIPATILLITLRAQIIRVILGTGQFNWQDTILTIDTLGFFSLSLFAQSLIPLLVRVFYARHDSKTPFIVGLITSMVNILLSLWLSDLLGIAGLALAFSLSNILNLIMLWLILHYKIGSLDELRILFSTIKFFAAAMACGAVIQGMKLIIWQYIDMTKFWGVLTQGAIAGLIGFFVYLLICLFLQSEELFDFWASIKRRLSWSKAETSDQGEARGI